MSPDGSGRIPAHSAPPARALPGTGEQRRHVLVAIVKKRLQLNASLYQILQILSLTLFERTPLDQLLARSISEEIEDLEAKQLILFD